MKIFIKKLILLQLIGTMFVPVVAVASSHDFDSRTGWNDQTGLIPCDDKVGSTLEPCGFNDILLLAGTIIRTLMWIGVVLTGFMFVWGAYLYIFNMGNPGQIKKANDKFKNAITGLIFLFGAWLIINIVTAGLKLNPLFNKYVETI